MEIFFMTNNEKKFAAESLKKFFEQVAAQVKTTENLV